MPFLSETDAAQLRDIFAESLSGNVRVRLFTQQASKLFIPGVEPRESCASCQETQDLLGEVAALSDHVELVVHDVKAEPDLAARYGVDGALPTIVLEPAVEPKSPQGRVRFLGIPAGYEFSTFVSDVVDVSNQRVDLTADAQAELRELQQDVHLQVFVTPT